MNNDNKSTLVIIDGKSVFYRGYYAMPNLSNKDGLPTGGIYGFSVMALEVIKRLKPNHVAVAWDKPKTNIRRRRQMYPGYKANRKPAPDDFYQQVPYLMELIDALGWHMFELDDYEADDIMGSLALKASQEHINTYLVTSDLDMLQLISPTVHVYVLKQGLSHIEQFSPDSFEEKYGIKTEQFLDLKALKGDSSDNIPGVSGIGEKTAISLLQQYQNLDNIYDNLALINPKLATKLEKDKDMAYLSKDLAKIWIDAPVAIDFNIENHDKVDKNRLIELLNQFDFKSLIKPVSELFNIEKSDVSSVFDKGLNLPSKKFIRTKNDLKDLKTDGNVLSIYYRFTDKEFKNLSVFMTKSNDVVYIFDIKSIGQFNFIDWLKKSNILNKKIVGYDLKKLFNFCYQCNINPPTDFHDILVSSFLMSPLVKDQSLAGLAAYYINYDSLQINDLDDQELMSRGDELSAIIHEIYDLILEEIQGQVRLISILDKMDFPLIPVLAKMENSGIRVDVNFLNDFNKKIDFMINNLTSEIYKLAGREFNIASPIQLSEIIFGDLKIPTFGIKKNKTGYSTDSNQLEKIIEKHPIVGFIIQYREVVKIQNTYLNPLPALVDKDSLIHTTYNQTIAQTGRLSSVEPNLQNIPTRTELGRNIRKAFVAKPGYKLISADYSQFELRIAADLADDHDLIDLFNQEFTDIHTLTAAQVYGCQPSEVTKEMRRAAKAINFGILYGMSGHGLSEATAMTLKEANDFIEKYKTLHRPLFDFMEEVINTTKKNGYAETKFGRRRPIPNINSANFMLREAAKRAAINMPVQGTEADLMKLALIKIDDLLETEKFDARLVLQIHDSVLVECREGQVDIVSQAIKNTMENTSDLKVKLKVDIEVADNWGDL